LSKSVLAAAFAFALVACGGSDPSADSDGSTETGELLPLAVGNVWEYRVTATDGTITKKRTTVLDKEVVGGAGPYAALMAFKLVTRKGPDLDSETDLDKTESWQSPASECSSCGADVSRDPERILRYRELSYGAMTHLLQLEEFWDPPRIHVDGSADHTKSGALWIETYMETKLPTGAAAIPAAKEQDLWQVSSPSEAITVPEGSYEHSVHFTKTAGSVKDYWFKRGVGKLKEVGDNQTEELVSFTAAGATP
jgi:hypothetical protein